MVTVTFPARAASAPLPDRSLPVAAEGGGGFEALFALLQASSESTDEVMVPGAESTADGPAVAGDVEMSADNSDQPDQALPFLMPLVPPEKPLPAHQPAALLSGQDLAGVLQVTPGQPLAQLLVTAASMVVPPADPVDQSSPALTLPGVEAPDVTSVPAPATASPPPPTPVQPAMATPSLQPALPGADQPAQGPQGSGNPSATGLFVLADTVATPRRGPAQTPGVPAFWAAREAVENVPLPSTDVPNPVAPAALPKPVQQVQAAPPLVDPDAPMDEGAGVPLVTEGRTGLGQSSPQAPGFVPPSQAPVPAGPQGTPAPTMPPHVPPQIAALIAARSERPLELRLAPVELGGLTLNLRNDGDMLRVVLQADRPETLDLLRRNGDVLLEELRLAGFAGASLSFGDGGGAQDRGAPTSGSGSSSPSLPAPPVRAPVSALAPLQHGQGLDLRL